MFKSAGTEIKTTAWQIQDIYQNSHIVVDVNFAILLISLEKTQTTVNMKGKKYIKG